MPTRCCSTTSAHNLHPLGIDMVHDLAGVGWTLQDHLDFVLDYKTKDHGNFGIGLRVADASIMPLFDFRKYQYAE